MVWGFCWLFILVFLLLCREFGIFGIEIFYILIIMSTHKTNCNCIDCVWNRILDHAQTSESRPKSESKVFQTKARKINFWLVKQNSETIHPVNERNSNLLAIRKSDISKDISSERGGLGGLVFSDSPAPAYRYVLLNDPRIWK